MGMVKNGFFQGKRVLVTGADGFIGSHLTERLLSLGAEVSVYVRGSSQNGTTKFQLKNIRHLQARLSQIITGNIANTDSISLIRENSPQIIFHLAADAYVPKSFKHPFEVTETNLIGTINVLNSIMELPEIEQAVLTSSSEIYGTAQYVPINEEHPLNPTSPYAASKVAADRYCYAYWKTYNLPVSIIRPFNTYGPRHTYDVVPKFISMALEGMDLTVHGDGGQSRDFTYVTDMVEAFLLMGSDRKTVGQAINFGTGRAVTIKDLAEMIVRLSGSKSRIVHQPDRLAQVQCLLCDYRKGKELLGWEPTVPIEQGLEMNIAWEKERLKLAGSL